MGDRVQDHYDEIEFTELLNSASANAANDWEINFVSDMQDRFEEFGRRMYLSDAQREHLERISNDN